MSENGDVEKIQATLKELKSWADKEINHLERQFEARKKSPYLPYRMRSQISFFGGVLCGFIVAAILFYWLYPHFCGQ
jgi:hypothetical protein